ncbi:MAG: GH3 auxin-responsive promoter family protein [Verrucomicrobia bacterium]|nr:GH3 auxin-responsive promoter family protein [Verrucomicrobiota bacterium]MCH8512399.1 GH3 auxin-responsive promoter family protein [Kiritimatiellia bacterium]
MNKVGIIHELWHARCQTAARRFRGALDDPETAQRRRLADILRTQAHTAFGRAHGFASIRTYEEYARRVPLSDADDLARAVERMGSGEAHVLTRDPVRRWVPTSGSTSARKLIPWTRGLHRDFSMALDPWIDDLFRRWPELKAGPAYWSVSPALPEEAYGGIPVGFEDDTAYLGGALGRWLSAALAVPSEVRHETDIEAFRFRTLLHLVKAEELRLVSIWHPTFFRILMESLPRHAESIAQELHDTWRRTARAKALEKYNPSHPGKLWPHLGLISAWGKPDSPEVRDLTRLFPDVAFQEKGLLATEGVVSLPYAHTHPLAVTSHLVEFIDEADGVRPAWAVEAGKHYEVVLTTGGGLYRYRLRDRVEITGFLRSTPCLRFLGRAGGGSDMRGEKLEENFVAGVLDRLLPADARFRILEADDADDPPGYTLHWVAGDEAADTRDLAELLDTALRENPHYRLCRFLGQLRPASVLRLRPGEEAQWISHGGVKPGALGKRAVRSDENKGQPMHLNHVNELYERRDFTCTQ